MRSFVIFLLIAFCSCSLEINTVDPQACESISFSKKYNFYIDTYQAAAGPFSKYVKEVWIEKTWKNKISNFKVIREEIGTKQLVIRLDSNFLFHNSDYLLNWEMSDSLYGTLGLRSGAYTLSLPEDSTPNHFKIDVLRIQPKKQILYSFNLKPM